MRERMEKEGASGRFTDSEPEDNDAEEESKEAQGNTEDYEKKRRRKTKEDIEREALEKGDLYATLEL